jgi:PST family polysaccharide transporter
MLYWSRRIKAFQSEKSMNAVKGVIGDRNGLELSRSTPSDGSDPIGSSAEPFATQHLLPDLKRHTISGGVITMSAQGAKFVMSLVATVALARLLTPRDFGLIAMVTGVTGFLTVFRHAGLATPTIQREHITQAQVANLFWVNLGVSGLCTLIVAALAPVLAWFYHDSRLIAITLCLSTTFLIGGFRVQHLALLRRQLRFKAIAVIEVGSMALGVAVGIAMALLGFGAWSLVGMSLATELGSFIFTGSLSPWRPSWPSRQSGVRPLLAFGAHQTAASLLFSMARNCDALLIGRFYGAAALGLYSRGGALVIRPLEQFLLPINAVFLPTLSRLQSQPARYRSTFLRLYEAIALVTLFFTSLLLPLSYPLTLVLLGSKWERASVIFGGFTLLAIQIPLANVANWLLTSQGRGKDIFYQTAIASALTVGSFVAGLPFGPVGVAISFSISGLLLRLPILYYNVGRKGPVSTKDLWVRFFWHVPLWIIMFAATWWAQHLVADRPPWMQLLICLPVGAAIGVIFICVARPQRRVALHLGQSLLEFLNKRQKNTTT